MNLPPRKVRRRVISQEVLVPHNRVRYYLECGHDTIALRLVPNSDRTAECHLCAEAVYKGGQV